MDPDLKRATDARHASAQGMLLAAFAEYKQWQVAWCYAHETHPEPGDASTFLDWVADELCVVRR